MDFVTNIEEIQKRARRHIEEGPVTEGYALDRKQAIRVQRCAGHRVYVRASLSIPLFHGDRHQLVGGCRRIYGACSGGTGPCL